MSISGHHIEILLPMEFSLLVKSTKEFRSKANNYFPEKTTFLNIDPKLNGIKYEVLILEAVVKFNFH